MTNPRQIGNRTVWDFTESFGDVPTIPLPPQPWHPRGTHAEPEWRVRRSWWWRVRAWWRARG